MTKRKQGLRPLASRSRVAQEAPCWDDLGAQSGAEQASREDAGEGHDGTSRHLCMADSLSPNRHPVRRVTQHDGESPMHVAVRI